MIDDIFGGSTPKANVVWVPTALPALATTLLELSMVLIPIRSSQKINAVSDRSSELDYRSFP